MAELTVGMIVDPFLTDSRVRVCRAINCKNSDPAKGQCGLKTIGLDKEGRCRCYELRPGFPKAEGKKE